MPGGGGFRRLKCALACGALGLTIQPSLGFGQMPSTLTAFLQQTIGLTQDQIGTATSGKPVVKVLDPTDSREIAVFGIVQVAVPRAFYVRLVSDFPSSLRTSTRNRFALFSNPATSADVSTFSLPHDDVQELTHCRPGACKLKLSSRSMAGVHASMDSGATSPDSAANAFFRKTIVQYVTDYRARGNAALIVYEDERTTAAGDVFDSLLSHSPYLYRYAPSLERYLANYPGDRPADLAEVLFWAEDDLPSLRPTFTITHQVVYAPVELTGCTLVVSKQLYADHYLDGAVTVTAVVDGAEQAARSDIYLVLLRRLHFDNLPSGGVMNVRERVKSKLRDQAGSALRDAKARAEQEYASAPAAVR